LEPSKGSITVLYDNYVYEPGTRAEWGFSCLIQTSEKFILFDTGGEEEVLQFNIEALEIDVSDIDCIVISHEHWDHVGGIGVILRQKPNIPVYLPEDFPYHIMSSIRSLGGNCIENGNATKITDSVAITSTLSGPPNEQALIIQTNEGIILVTGCSHPGIENLVRNAFDLTEENIRFVIGGFHLGNVGNNQLSRICDELDEIGVMSLSASHCTGDDSIDYFREHYGDVFVESGVGFVYEFI
jgi:7,8-dihydropterin-6-yl-methyl-4-(beta-D-ribofuranosyl)aminobenzene 5'-phosphate synthase